MTRVRYLVMLLAFTVVGIILDEAGHPFLCLQHDIALALDEQPAQTPQQWTITHTLKHESGVTVVAMSPSGREVAAGGILSAGISIWDVERGTPIRQLTGLKGGVQALAYSPDGRLFATGRSMIKSTDTSVYVFQAGTDTMLQRLQPPQLRLALLQKASAQWNCCNTVQTVSRWPWDSKVERLGSTKRQRDN